MDAIAKVLMGGTSSSGSSLLRTILNRHPKVFSGAELNFFNKEQVFEDWSTAKMRLLMHRFPHFTTKGWSPYPGHSLLRKDYNWSQHDLNSIIKASQTLPDFVEAFFRKPLTQKGASLWVEKTPSNAYSFRHFLRLFSEGKVIHTTRNPRDAVASLVRRGFPPIYAAGVWVYNTAAALAADKSERYILMKYEELVTNSEEEIIRLSNFLDIYVDLSILKPSTELNAEGIVTWQYQPDQQIGTLGLESFDRTNMDTQREIITALSLFQISQRHVSAKKLLHSNCSEICESLGYDFEPYMCADFKRKIRADLIKDMTLRSLKCFETGWTNFPARIFF